MHVRYIFALVLGLGPVAKFRVLNFRIQVGSITNLLRFRVVKLDLISLPVLRKFDELNFVNKFL